MSLALLPVLNVELIDRIYDFLPTEPEIEWETLYGADMIYRTKHWVTQGGGPYGGYVYFYKERPEGWYRWCTTWGGDQVYERIRSGIMVWRHAYDEDEKCAIIPDNYEELGIELDEDTMIMDDDRMKELYD